MEGRGGAPNSLLHCCFICVSGVLFRVLSPVKCERTRLHSAKCIYHYRVTNIWVNLALL